MPAGPPLRSPLPTWADPQQASVFDAPLTSMIRAIVGGTQKVGEWTGMSDPQNQALALMNPMEVGPSGGLVGLLNKVIKAYHGSPHDFDAFSMDKIGTGEGAQAYGHGLYFAENPEVAKTYQAKVSAMQGGAKPTVQGRPINWDDPAETAAFELWRHDGDRKAAAEFYAKTFRRESPVVALLQSETPLPTVTPPGRMYEVNIHANPDDLLDWDKPLSQQSEHVRSKMQGLLKEHGGSARYQAEKFGDDPEGLKLYRELDTGGGKIAERLREAGIPGLKYLDGGSRGAGEGTRNYVIWDDKLIEILKKYGVALPAIEGLRREAMSNGGRVDRQRVEQVMQ